VKTRRGLDRRVPGQRANALDMISLMARKGSARDLLNCYALHESLRLPYAQTGKDTLLEMWRALLSTGAMQLSLVEDRTRLVGSRVVAFRASVFVNDEFCLEAQSMLRPYLGVELAQRYLAHELPALNREQIAQANARDGLNVVMCFEGWAEYGITREHFLAVREKQSEAFYLSLRGYRLKEFLAEPVGTETAQWMLGAGARLRHDYSNYFRKNRLLERENSKRPYLVGLTKEEALAHPGSSIAGLFIHTAPRFHFNFSQRVLLQHALTGETCEQLAVSLSLSPWTVKKRWQAIYDRVADVDSELLPPPISYSAHALSRGAERRRQLLNYLRQHLEELRPYRSLTHRHPGRTPSLGCDQNKNAFHNV